MAKNREPEKPVESESESGEGDGASSEEVGSSESESDSEPEQSQVKPSSSTPATLKKSQPQSSSKTQQQRPSSSSDEEDSGSESDGNDQNGRPLASKPVDVSQKSTNGARKPKPKPSSSEPVTPAKSTGLKRLAEEKEAEAKDAKRPKKKPEPESSDKKSNDDSKKQLFQRLWSEGDEIVILKGMSDYADKKKSDPVSDLNAFHDFIKDSLHVDVTKTQLQHKIRRLKKKYENNKSKENEGKDRTFSKPHEQKAYELSKHIWGSENGKENGGVKANGSLVRKSQSKQANTFENGESKDVRSLEVANGDLDEQSAAKIVSSDYVTIEEGIMRIGAELFEGEQGVEGGKEWRKLKLEEMEVYLKKLDLMRAQTKLVWDVLKSMDH